jgi:hypothetical protein
VKLRQLKPAVAIRRSHKRDRGREVFDNDADMLHPLDCHALKRTNQDG